MNLKELSENIKDEPGYRAKQIKKGIFVDLYENWDAFTGLPKTLRESLNQECSLEIRAEVFSDKNDSTVKALITLEDGKKVETVLMRHEDGRNTVCVSCQVGCPMACAFCATGKMSLHRNLDAHEIVEQVLFFARLLSQEKKRVSGVVFMGMGEPFSNYEAVMTAVRILNDHEGLNIGARHISISTCGIIDGIKRLAGEKIQVNLAISLHAPDDKTRRLLMPVARTYTVAELLEAVDAYIAATHRKVMFEYLMIGGVNDSDTHVTELVKLLKGKLCMVNLIAYNSTGVFKSADTSRLKHFKNELTRAGIDTTIRYRHGREVKGACGQLATIHEDIVLPESIIS